MAPSQLNIATSSLHRLVREISSYKEEWSGQEKRLKRLQEEEKKAKEEGNGEDEGKQNLGYEIRQMVTLFFFFFAFPFSAEVKFILSAPLEKSSMHIHSFLFSPSLIL